MAASDPVLSVKFTSSNRLDANPPSSTSTTSLSMQCPVALDSSSLNPLNNLPYLSQSPYPGQIKALPVARETSSIPRVLGSSCPAIGESKVHRHVYFSRRHLLTPPNSAQSNWEYPSPQQFYNALRRKGWDFPEAHIEPMVVLHNRLNEQAWAKILKWESRGNGG
jgi:cytochrome c heme-lyase